ncbi:MAG: hypothetical protein ACTHN5_06950 [Phycisphaerae bacterium]
MKCHCPACGRSTEIDPATLGFFARCVRCGALIKSQLQEEEGFKAIAARVIHPGRLRESQSSTGQIADLLSRPLPPRAAPQPPGHPIQPMQPQEDTNDRLYALAPAPPKPATTVADLQIPELPPKYRRRVALRERQQMLGMVTVFGIGLSALVAVGAIAIKSRDFFVRHARATTNDIVQPLPDASQSPASSPADTPQEADAQSAETPNEPPHFTVGDRPTANPAADGNSPTIDP